MITTKDNLCQVSIELFREHSFEQVSINMICAHLHVTRGSFYHHFASKNELLLYWFANMVNQEIELNTSPSSPKLALKQHALDYAALIQAVGYDLMYHILMAEFELEGRHFYTYFKNEDQSIALIQRALELGEIKAQADAKQLLDVFTSAMIGAIVTWKFHKGQYNIVNKIEALFETIYR